MGTVPFWYRVLKAAQYLKVAPWELAERPVWWLQMAEEAMSAEAKDQKRRENESKHKSKS